MKRERKAIFKELSSAAPDVSENVKNAVDWGKVAAENTEKRKKLSKPFPFLSHTLFNIVKRSSKTVPVFSDNTIFYSKKSF